MLPAVTGRPDFAALVVRTDFGDEPAWRSLLAALSGPCGDGAVEADVHVVDDPAWSGAAVGDVIAAVSADEDLSVVFLADDTTMRDPEHALLAVAVVTRDECENDEEFATHSGSVRAVPAGIHEIHANLSIANLDFVDVVETARLDPAGVFRGF
ncbi:DUF6924 domain-containing protein [Streptomyces sp. NRRL B-24484]|uniref:DUF6924 domain-containing protein n=1 Tax=Streptomyces sp. NRRL B-24484 TaxID=1463833 RepID=UPI000AF05B60|nr:hypothetical protein [Streptomyces sp. NRRL B-24484]